MKVGLLWMKVGLLHTIGINVSQFTMGGSWYKMCESWFTVNESRVTIGISQFTMGERWFTVDES